MSDVLYKDGRVGGVGPLWINGPPSNLKCQCCKRHISKLEPFDDPEDPDVVLFKNFRCDPGDEVIFASWECRDCLGLDFDDYYRKAHR